MAVVGHRHGGGTDAGLRPVNHPLHTVDVLDAVVARDIGQGAVDQANALDGHGFACARIFIREAQNARLIDFVACLSSGQHAHQHARAIGQRGAIVGFANGGGLDFQGCRGDVGRRQGLRSDVVVANILAIQSRADDDRFGLAHMARIKTARGRKGHHIILNQTVKDGCAGDHFGLGVAVIDLVGRRQAADVEVFLGDVGGGGGLIGDGVVAQIGTR